MPLEEYRRKRRFSRTPEPAGEAAAPPSAGHSFVIQKHRARRLHYDLRLELDGVLKSWAVPKGPSLDPKEKRLAVQVEDHPLEYGDFEGVIPEGEYGAGSVLVWDRGTWTPVEDPSEGLRQGKLKFRLDGEKLHGGWALVRLRDGNRGKDWLLIKEKDDEAQPGEQYDVVDELPASVVSDRTLEEVAADRDRTWTSSGPGGPDVQSSRSPPSSALRPAKLPKARKGPLPRDIRPALATLAREAPAGDRWLHEIKFDGYRMLCRIDRDEVQIHSRTGHDWTARLRTIANACKKLPAKQAILDGEVVVYTTDGTTSFQALQNALHERGGSTALAYLAFDLLYLDGYDLRKVPLIDRKETLAALVGGGSGSAQRIRFSEHIEGDGPQVLAQACNLGMEGIVSKRSDRPYPSGRSRDWLKIKCLQSEEFVIGGFTKSSSSARTGFGALLLGYYDDRDRLIYAGRVGTGFTEATLEQLGRRLREAKQPESPFANLPTKKAPRDVLWTAPELVAHVEYSGWTRDGLLRHARYRGLREDKPPHEVHRERPVDVEPGQGENGEKGMARSRPAELDEMRLTHADRIVYPEVGVTKLGIATYYAEAATWVLPHLVERPLTLVRCPEGRHKSCFYQKHVPAGLPESVVRLPIEEKGEIENYMAVRDLEGVLALVQFGVLEFHVWGSRTDAIERPDRMVFDLDPDPTVAWPSVIEAALSMRDVLDDLGLQSFVKTTGGKGLHVVVPLERRQSWDDAKEFSRLVATRVAQRAPERYTLTMSKAARRGKIYLDFHRNGRGATWIAPYSTRARNGAPVSMPLGWDELQNVRSADYYTVTNTPRRLAALKQDPWADIGSVRQSLTKKMWRALEADSDRRR